MVPVAHHDLAALCLELHVLVPHLRGDLERSAALHAGIPRQRRESGRPFMDGRVQRF
ncbi:MAG TPA: hypothetical protein VNE42_05205 [Acidimicrobiales bacterium]|nr:hypothetical protein [Acidimicrobiales bacterium]